MRCDTQRDVYVIERFGGLDMSRMKKPKKPKGYGGEEFDIHETHGSKMFEGLTDDKLEACLLKMKSFERNWLFAVKQGKELEKGGMLFLT